MIFMETERKILIASSLIFILIIIASVFFIKDFTINANLLILGLIILVAPYTIYKFFEFKRIRAIEQEFPNFLRDLSESIKAELNIVNAIKAAGRSDYGMLSREIKIMSNQLSWNIPLEIVLKNFAKRMNKSKMITKAVMIIDQANKSGGNVEDTMEALSLNIDSLKEAQEEKSSLMSQQVMMMYGIFFIFLGISVSLIKFLIPMMQTQASFSSETTVGMFQGIGSSNPCAACVNAIGDPACMSCEIFFGVSKVFGFGERSEAASYYRSLFFTMVLIQGMFSGLIAGQIGSDSVVAGMKHSFIMVFSGFLIFIISLRVGFI
jgi:flagellar protein FlaJ